MTYLGGATAIAIFMELGPGLTALVLAGRIGASIAAEPDVRCMLDDKPFHAKTLSRKGIAKKKSKKPLRILCVSATLRALLIFFFRFRFIRVRNFNIIMCKTNGCNQ